MRIRVGDAMRPWVSDDGLPLIAPAPDLRDQGRRELLMVPRPVRRDLRALGLALGDARRERDDGIRGRRRGGGELLRLDPAARARARAGGAARGDRGRRDRPVPVRRRDEDEPRDRLAGRRVPRGGRWTAGDAGDHGARLRRGDPASRRGLVLGRRAALLGGRRLPVEVVVSLLVSMNLVLLLFNLVPAFPLDGGRIARAAAWKLTGDRHRATRFAARIGIAFGWMLVGLGLLLIVAYGGDAAFDSTWFAALGWLLASAARTTLAQSAFTEQLEGITVADVMDSEPVTIPSGLTAARAYEDYFLRYQGWEWFAVVEDDGRFVGLAHRRAVEHAALEEGGDAPVREV